MDLLTIEIASMVDRLAMKTILGRFDHRAQGSLGPSCNDSTKNLVGAFEEADGPIVGRQPMAALLEDAYHVGLAPILRETQ
eukprot:10835273-Alexandrium_andersonii.AAC.1